MTYKPIWSRFVALALLGAVVAAIFALSSQPFKAQTIQPFLQKNLSVQTAERVLPHLDIRYDGHEYRSDANPLGLIEFLFRKGAHMFVYGVLAAAAALALRMYRLPLPAVAGLSLAAVFLVAMLDEWNQRYSQDRTPAFQDVLVDLTGGAISLLLCYGISRLYRRLRR
ncbi:VanZ family protein [Cohnella thailandensis]|uniref:VanZ family protein n=1 Tax=Cohnella thailandensis TaxID=557557 RepID=A0A841SX41_9BACL|nr:VanZ family protein [Cohnella thailandensis]MBB6635832.1 VanZ family protein [Cohnella thailandensis]MBP1976210.1 VanZ family protein [Cohnella thailandensis]